MSSEFAKKTYLCTLQYSNQSRGSLDERKLGVQDGGMSEVRIIHQRLKNKVKQNILNLFLPAAAKLLQLCLTLCDPIDSSPPGSPIPGILQARTLEWVAISFSTISPNRKL